MSITQQQVERAMLWLNIAKSDLEASKILQKIICSIYISLTPSIRKSN